MIKFYEKIVDKNVVKIKFLWRLFRITKIDGEIAIFKFLGLPLINDKFLKKMPIIEGMHESKMAKIDQSTYDIKQVIESLKQDLEQEVSSLKTMLLAQTIHKETFGKYKNAFEGRDVVLVCTGPTAKKYVPIENAIHVGVNGAVYLDNVKLDYLFVQDYTVNQSTNNTLNADCNAYVGNNCKKFYGVISDYRLKDYQNSNCPIWRIPINQTYKENVFQYVLEGKNFGTLAYDLEKEPIGDFFGTVFSAMQFILYTNPRRIYLVGCDCGSGYAYDKPNALSPEDYQIEIWQKYIKPFIDNYYSNIEVISINTVGLKGLFVDSQKEGEVL